MRLLKSGLRFLSTKKKKQKGVTAIAITPQQEEHMKIFKSQKLNLNIGKVLPQINKKNSLVTSALPYVNNVPHLGNIIGALLSADVSARFRRLNGQNVLFICGTDQYGTATQMKAKQAKKTPKQICDQYHILHKQIYQWFDISYNHFGRTSNPIHTETVQEIFMQCYKNGFFTEKQINQFHCQSCNTFLADRFVVGNCKSCKSFTKADQCDSCNKVFESPQNDLDNIKCAVCSSTPQLKSSKHLFFNFEKNPTLLEKLRLWVNENNRIQSWSNNAKGQTRNWLKQNVLRDRCMTRDLKWGINVPLQKFKDKVFYVWFDAPIGYISMTKQLMGNDYEKWWKKNNNFDVQLIQFMGKDNIMFHSILFPSTLISATLNSSFKYNLVQKLCVTEYLRYEGEKFSKSQNRGVFGNDCAKTGIQSDVWRYYLLSNRPQIYDCQFVWQQFASKNNKQLMNSIGNLYHRILKITKKDFNGLVPELLQFGQPEKKFIVQMKKEVDKYFSFLNNNQIKFGAESLLQISYILNSYVQFTQFWKNKQRKNIILSFLLRNLCVFGHLLEPYIPQTSARIYYLLGIQNSYKATAFQQMSKDFEGFFTNCLQKSTGLKESLILFTENNLQFNLVSADKANELCLKYGKSVKQPQPKETQNTIPADSQKKK